MTTRKCKFLRGFILRGMLVQAFAASLCSARGLDCNRIRAQLLKALRKSDTACRRVLRRAFGFRVSGFGCSYGLYDWGVGLLV